MGIPILGDVINAVKDLVSEVVVDKDKKNELNVRLQELEDQANARYHEEVMGQIDVNKVEAASGSVFVAGWRPAIGWVGATALAYAYVINPFIGIWHATPVYDLAGLANIVYAMLGIGAMRTYEKVKGVSTNDYTDVPKAEPDVKEQKPKRFKL
jgi:hypothetical protein